MTLKLPPLRDRGDDVSILVDHFAGPDWTVESAAREAMQHYHWPGNVRQLINAIERAKILADDEVIRLQNLPSVIAEYVTEFAGQLALIHQVVHRHGRIGLAVL